MKVTVLGSGTSAGVPMIGCDCPVCTSTNPKNKRRRCSILIEAGGQTIIVDTGPDFRAQCLDAGVKKLDAVLYTHVHADHVHGIDDIRTLNNAMGKPVQAYAAAQVFDEIAARFAYAFGDSLGEYGFWRPSLEQNVVDGPFKVGNVEITPILQHHGRNKTWGFRIGDFAYSPDVDFLPDESFAALAGVRTWIVDALRDRKHPSHAHLDLTLSWIARVKPELSALIHMNHEVDHDTWMAKLPPGVVVAYDGMVIDCTTASEQRD